VPLGILAYNLATLSLREIMENPLYLFIGYRCKIPDFYGRHIKLIEDYVYEGGEIKKKFTKSGVAIDDSTMKRLEQLVSEGLIGERVWVTPGLPFMVPITAGFVSAIIYGDLMLGIAVLLM
jgi:preflagellin peptidase FlaK